jgi:type IV secretory pathway VirB9-like protein
VLERAALAGHREAASYDPQNRGGRALYANLGFVATGEFEDGESVAAVSVGERMKNSEEVVERRVPVDLRAREPDDRTGFRRRSALHHHEVEVNQ